MKPKDPQFLKSLIIDAGMIAALRGVNTIGLLMFFPPEKVALTRTIFVVNSI